MRFEIPSWLSIDDEDAIPTLDGIPFWEWPKMSPEWRAQHGLPTNTHHALLPVEQQQKLPLKTTKKRKSTSRTGRPLKYTALLSALDPDEVYTPAVISHFAEEHGFLEDGIEIRLQKQRIRIALGRFAANHNFPGAGDGSVYMRGQSPKQGWYGWRWQETANLKPKNPPESSEE